MAVGHALWWAVIPAAPVDSVRFAAVGCVCRVSCVHREAVELSQLLPYFRSTVFFCGQFLDRLLRSILQEKKEMKRRQRDEVNHEMLLLDPTVYVTL